MRLDHTRFDEDPPVYLSYRQACQIIRRALASLPGQGHGLTVGRARGMAGNHYKSSLWEPNVLIGFCFAKYRAEATKWPISPNRRS